MNDNEWDEKVYCLPTYDVFKQALERAKMEYEAMQYKPEKEEEETEEE